MQIATIAYWYQPIADCLMMSVGVIGWLMPTAFRPGGDTAVWRSAVYAHAPLF